MSKPLWTPSQPSTHHRPQQQRSTRERPQTLLASAYLAMMRGGPRRLAAESPARLVRVLGAFDLVMIGVATILGAGIFVLTGVAARDLAGPAVVLSFTLAGVAAMASCICYAEFASEVAVTGGAYVYTTETFGTLAGWLVAINLLLEYLLASSAVSKGFSAYLATLAGQSPSAFLVPLTGDGSSWSLDMPAAACLLVLGCVLVWGLRQAAWFNNVFTLIVLVTAALVMFAGFSLSHTSHFHPFAPFGAQGILRGASVVFFAYIGFDAVAVAAEESTAPARDVPIGLIGSLAMCAIIYILMAVAIVGMVPYNSIDSTAPFAVAFKDAGLGWASTVISLGALSSVLDTVVCTMFAAARLLVVLGRAELMPAWLATVNRRTHTPVAATALVVTLAAALAAFLTVDVLASLVSIGTLMSFTAVCIAVFWRRISPPPDQAVILAGALALGPGEADAAETATAAVAATTAVGCTDDGVAAAPAKATALGGVAQAAAVSQPVSQQLPSAEAHSLEPATSAHTGDGAGTRPAGCERRRATATPPEPAAAPAAATAGGAKPVAAASRSVAAAEPAAGELAALLEPRSGPPVAAAAGVRPYARHHNDCAGGATPPAPNLAGETGSVEVGASSDNGVSLQCSSSSAGASSHSVPCTVGAAGSNAKKGNKAAAAGAASLQAGDGNDEWDGDAATQAFMPVAAAAAAAAQATAGGGGGCDASPADAGRITSGAKNASQPPAAPSGDAAGGNFVGSEATIAKARPAPPCSLSVTGRAPAPRARRAALLLAAVAASAGLAASYRTGAHLAVSLSFLGLWAAVTVAAQLTLPVVWHPPRFRVPLFPWLPSFGLMANIVLMGSLEWKAWTAWGAVTLAALAWYGWLLLRRRRQVVLRAAAPMEGRESHSAEAAPE